MQKPTPKRLRELLSYDPDTGLLHWRITRGRSNAGDIAGCVSFTEKRVLIGVDGTVFKAHRVIWAIMTGRWPRKQIDHRDENGCNNRWENLREATKAQNMRNISRIKSNTSGFKGVNFDPRYRKPWGANIKLNGIRIYLGRGATAEEASALYEAASIELHGEFSSVHKNLPSGA